jgi:hypothetical protein
MPHPTTHGSIVAALSSAASDPLVQARLNLRETERILNRAYAHLRALGAELARQQRVEREQKEARS